MSIFKNNAPAELPAGALFWVKLVVRNRHILQIPVQYDRLVDSHNADSVLLAENVVFFRQCMICNNGIQLLHWRVSHK